jgi:ribosome maturation factor RimP
MAIEDRVHAIVDPIIEDLALELVDLVYAGGRLKITIDQPGGLDSEMLTRATRMISHDLDLEDPITGTYTLEVSTPGVERELRTPAHFLRSVGEQVTIKLVPNDSGLRRVRGELIGADDIEVTIREEDGNRTIPYEEISKAKTVFDWGPAPKPGKAKKKQPSGAKATASRKAETP